MFNITPYITLSSTQKKYYTFIRISVFSLFIIFSALFVKEFIFPTQTFHFNHAIDSLANTISRPYESKDGTSFHISTDGESDNIKIYLTLPKDVPALPQDTTILIRKSYLSFLSPINTQKYTDHIVTTYNDMGTYYIKKDDTLFPLISENAFDSYLFKDHTENAEDTLLTDLSRTKDSIGFAPATLISSKNSIYITDDVVKHPLQDEYAFHALGYNFDNVIQTNSEERSAHKNAKLFSIKSAHPFGTIFYAEDADRTYIYDNDMLNKIQTTSTTKQHAIITDETSRDTTASCTLKKVPFSHRYTCSTSIENIKDFNGNTYQFALKNAPSTLIATTKIKLFTTVNETSLARRTALLKDALNTIYN